MKKQTRLLFLLLLSVACVLSISSGALAQNGGAGAPKPPMAEHFGSPRFVVLRVVVDIRNALRVVVLACLLAIRTSRLCIDY